MKRLMARLAAVSGLAAIVMADALPPEDIPIICATICGPIVELSSICNVRWEELKRRQVEVHQRWEPTLTLDPRHEEWHRDDDADAEEDSARINAELERRTFEIIVAAPTSFPVAEPAVTTSSAVKAVSTTAQAIPTVETSTTSTTTTSTSSSTSTSTSTSTSSTIAKQSSTHSTTSLSKVKATTTSSLSNAVAQQKGSPYDGAIAEEDCVCLNKSFNVSLVAALCASCITLAGYPKNNVDIIVADCNFTSSKWTPADDSLVNNVRVKATKPTVVSGTVVVATGDAMQAIPNIGVVWTLTIGVSLLSIMIL